MTDHTKPQIWIGCLASYNKGNLHGQWVDATLSLDALEAAAADILRTSPEPGAEEYAIFDLNNLSGVDMYTPLKKVRELALFVEEYPDFGDPLLEYLGYHLEDAKRAVEDHYEGAHESLEDYAREYWLSTGELDGVPEEVQQYIRYEDIGLDWEMSGAIFTIETGHKQVHVFTAL